MMNSSYGDGLLCDFDLDFLPKTLPLEHKFEKQKRALRIAKHKVIATDAMIEKYIKLKEVKDSLQRSLQEEREQYKQVCLDYNNATEKVTSLEESEQQLKTQNRQLEERCNHSENMFSANQSHVNQLQSLIKLHETKIESLEIENRLGKTGTKEKHISTLQKEKHILQKDFYILKDVLCGKRDKNEEIVKGLLKKYDSTKNKYAKRLPPAEDYEEPDSTQEKSTRPILELEDSAHSWVGDDNFEDCEPELSQSVVTNTLAIESKIELCKKIEEETTQECISNTNIKGASKQNHEDTCGIDLDSESSNENDIVRSVDTGRGSSLAFSGSEKCFLSPEYFDNDSPLNSELPLIQDSREIIVEKNAQCVTEKVNRATSPMVFENTLKDVATSPIKCGTNPEVAKKIMNEETVLCKIVMDSATSPIKFLEEQVTEDVFCLNKMTPQNSSQLSKHEAVLVEPQCIEVNENSVDCEVSTILNTMRLDYSLITPLAPSPTPSTRSNTSTNKIENTSHQFVCPEAAKMQKENKDLHVKMADLTKAVLELQSMMKNYFVNQTSRPSEMCKNQDLARKEVIPEITFESEEDYNGAPSINIETENDFAIEPVERTVLNNEAEIINDVVPVKGPSTEPFVCSNSSPVNIEEDTARDKLVTDKEYLLDDNDAEHDQISGLTPSKYEKHLHLNNCDKSLKPGQENNNNHVPKLRKAKKMTKLETLRKRLVPKNKIKALETPSKRRKTKSALKILPLSIKSSKLASSATLNDKAVYEKALLVAAEFRAQQKLKGDLLFKTKKNITLASKREKHKEEKIVNNDQTSPKSLNSSVQVQNTKINNDKNVDNSNSFSKILFEEKPPVQNNEEQADSKNKTQRKRPFTPDPVPKSTERVTRSKTNRCNLTLPNSKQSLLFENNKDTEEINLPATRSRQRSVQSALFEDDPSIKTERSNSNKTTCIETRKSLRRNQRQTEDKLATENEISSKCCTKRDVKNSPKRTRRNSLTLWIEDCQLSIANSDQSDKNENNSPVVLSPQEEKDNSDDKDTDRSSPVKVCKRGEETPRKESDDSKRKEADDKKVIHDNNGDKNAPLRKLSLDCNRTREAERRISITVSPTVLVARLDLEEMEKQVSPRRLSFSKSPKDAATRTSKKNSLKRPCDDITEEQSMRLLRSARVSESENVIVNKKTRTSDVDVVGNHKPHDAVNNKPHVAVNNKPHVAVNNKPHVDNNRNVVDNNKNVEKQSMHLKDYSDLGLFSDTEPNNKCSNNSGDKISNNDFNQKDSALCKMIEKYGKTNINRQPREEPDYVISNICKKIEKGIEEITELQTGEAKDAMDNLTEDLKRLKHKRFILGLMMYLKHPDRRIELASKSGHPPTPAMTKPEQILLYIIPRLQKNWPFVNIIDEILKNMEFTIFRLNATPDFDTIESLSHFYAVLCRFNRAKNRLRLFMLDAMYCISFKAVPLIKQCLEVWTHVVPLAHMGLAKCPIVVCFVYLLHFYKCENDSFNRVDEIRRILHRRYFYEMADWNETKMLEFLKSSLLELREIPIEKKMIRLALIIFAKRHGPQWCLKNIINNLILPIIQNDGVPARIKQFCISTLGPLLKPFPKKMKIHCEIVMNQLLDRLEKSESQEMEESIFTSLLYMRNHNIVRVQKALLSWRPCGPISPDLEQLLAAYVRERPIKVWISFLSRKY